MKNALSTKNQWPLFISLYTTQSIGLGFMMVALVGILRNRGTELTDLSFIYVLGIPWILKFLWAPIVDRFGVKQLGHYRSWILILQALMVLCLLIISQLSLDNQLPLIVAVGMLFVTCSATQDIAVDALASLEFDHQQRGVVNGIQMAGGMLGNMIGGGLILILYPYMGWQGVFYLMALVTSISWLQLLFFREKARHDTKRTLSVGQTFKHFVSFWRGKGLWLVFLPMSTISCSFVYAILTPMLVDAGKTLSEIGLMVNLFGMGIGVAMGLLSGWLIQRLGRKKALLYFHSAQIIGFVAMLPVAYMNSNTILYLTCALYFINYALVRSISMTFMMDYAAHSDVPATDYAQQFTVSIFSAMLMGAVGLQIAHHVGYLGVIISAIGLAVFALLLAFIYAKQLPEYPNRKHSRL